MSKEDRNVRIFNIKYLEYEIEVNFMNHMATRCNKAIRKRQELEAKARYYNSPHEIAILQMKMSSLDFTPCEKYQKYQGLIR